MSTSWSLFVTDNHGIFVDNGCPNSRIDRWSINNTRLQSPMFFTSGCSDLFIDINNHTYCSLSDNNQVISKAWNDQTNTVTVNAGTGCRGNETHTLNYPVGIFVTDNLDMYVADCDNDRIQFFSSGNLNGTTVVGATAAGTITLNHPSGITMDADGYLFIVDCGNSRIIGSDSYGYRCVVGCSGSAGSTANQLRFPWNLSFDNFGNIFVVDTDNNRIQKFGISSNKSCSKWR
jgi:hypothetical protein